MFCPLLIRNFSFTSFPPPQVIPAQAGIQAHVHIVVMSGWIPAFAGMTRMASLEQKGKSWTRTIWDGNRVRETRNVVKPATGVVSRTVVG